VSTTTTNGHVSASNGQSDIPSLTFVNPDELVTTYRVCLWAAPGQGKSVIACSAPGPILVLSADRPTAYQFARAYWTGQRDREIREIRYIDVNTLRGILKYLREDPAGREIQTVVVDPLSNIYDQLVRTAPKRNDGEVDYQAVNLTILSFLTALRPLDVNVVLIAHEKLNDGKKGDGLLYPALGGPSLINKVLAEMDICSHIERQTRTIDVEGRSVEQARYVGQLQPANGIVCKESTVTDLGPYRIADLSRWFAVANTAADEGMPWAEVAADGWTDVSPGDADAPEEPVAVEQPDAPTPEASATSERVATSAAAATPGPAEPNPALASVIADLEELLSTDDGLGELRRAADERMRDLDCWPGQRYDEIKQAGDKAGLRALLGRLPAPTPDSATTRKAA
jgi:hypothetical protein